MSETCTNPFEDAQTCFKLGSECKKCPLNKLYGFHKEALDPLKRCFMHQHFNYSNKSGRSNGGYNQASKQGLKPKPSLGTGVKQGRFIPPTVNYYDFKRFK